MREALTKKMKRKGYITVAEAAKRSHVPLSTFYGWLDRNLVRNRKIGGGRYVHVHSLKEYLR